MSDSSDESPQFECDECGARLKSAAGLQTHKTHNCSYRPNRHGVKCDQCDKVLTSALAVQQHAKRMHAKGVVRRSECPECHLKFLHSGDLKRHMFVHTRHN